MRVTIGLPYRNAEKTLPDALRSIFAQTHQDWTLLAVDDGSSDCSTDILRSVDDPRLTILSDSRSLGLSQRLNQISHLADTQLLFRMDADDLMHPDRLTAQIGYLEANPVVQVLGTLACTIDADSRVTGQLPYVEFPQDRKGAILSTVFPHPTVCANVSWFRNNKYDATFHRGQDRELWARTFRREEFARLNRNLLYYRLGVNTGSDSYSASKAADRRVLTLYRSEISRPVLWAAQAAATVKPFIRDAQATLGLQVATSGIRPTPLQDDQTTRMELGLKCIRQTAVPGLT